MTGTLAVVNGEYHIILLRQENGAWKTENVPTGLYAKDGQPNSGFVLQEFLNETVMPKTELTRNTTIPELVRYWLAEKSTKVDPVTLQGYEFLAKRHVIPYFEKLDITLGNVTYDAIQKYLDTKEESGNLRGGGLSARSLKLHKNILRQSLDLAVRDRILQGNPCDFVTLPEIEQYEADFYDHQELSELFRKISDNHLYPIVKITALYGLRRSEVLGLKWNNINFRRRTMTIRHTVAKVTQTVSKDRTKNATSRRTFPLTDDMIQLLQKMKDAEDQNRASYGDEYHENDYVFKWSDGRPFTPDYVSRTFRRLLEINDLRPIRFHDLRHSCASLLIDMGWTLKDVQEWLGHSDIKMTANIYTHLNIARKVKIAKSVSAKF